MKLRRRQGRSRFQQGNDAGYQYLPNELENAGIIAYHLEIHSQQRHQVVCRLTVGGGRLAAFVEAEAALVVVDDHVVVTG